MEQDAEVEDQDRQLGEGEAERVEEEAVPLLLRCRKSDWYSRGARIAGRVPYHLPLM
jgi:hypothetical protein